MQQLISEVSTYPLPMVFDIERKDLFEDPRPFKWTKEQYYKLAELGFFEGKRTELIEGEIIEMPTMNTPHATAVRKVNRLMNQLFSANHIVDVQMPLNIGENSEAVPDVAVLEGQIDDFREEHPKNAVLIVEVADTTLRQDRTKKVRLYAQCGITEYWVVNIPERCVEVFRNPSGKKYTEIFIFDETAFVSPLARPDAQIAVIDLLP